MHHDADMIRIIEGRRRARIGDAHSLCRPPHRPRSPLHAQPPAPLHPRRGRATPALLLAQWPEGRAQFGREELQLPIRKHWLERGIVERRIP
jgi:hypothetical protein